MITNDFIGAQSESQVCSACPIRDQAICSRCEVDELTLLEKIKTYRSFQKGSMITITGSPMTHVGTLVSGVASVSQGMEDGRRQILGILLPSDFVGRPGGRHAQYDIIAATDVLMCRFETTAFESLLNSSPTLGPRLLEMTMDELDAAREWMLLLGRKTAREKIASLIYMIGLKAKALSKKSNQNDFEFTLPLTRETLSDYIGLTTETVSRQITALRNDRIIFTKGQRQFIIPDFLRLLEETGDDYSGDIIS